MPPLISPSPTILDQSFPKSKDQLEAVLLSLGEMESLLADDTIHILLTETLAEWVMDYEWSPPEHCPMLNEIFQFASHLFLSPKEGLIRLDLTEIGCELEEYHPLREDYKNVGWSELWSLEMGKLFKLHTSVTRPNEYFIGIACEYGLSGRDTKEVPDTVADRSFPLIGNDNLRCLEDAYDWVTNAGILGRDVPFSQAKKAIFLLGATEITKSRGGGSHHSVHFKGARSWPLDTNDDPVPLHYLRGLVPITKKPIEVIIHVLLHEAFPPKRLKIPRIYIV